jgi:hypothetical protein
MHWDVQQDRRRQRSVHFVHDALYRGRHRGRRNPPAGPVGLSRPPPRQGTPSPHSLFTAACPTPPDSIIGRNADDLTRPPRRFAPSLSLSLRAGSVGGEPGPECREAGRGGVRGCARRRAVPDGRARRYNAPTTTTKSRALLKGRALAFVLTRAYLLTSWPPDAKSHATEPGEVKGRAAQLGEG